ALAPALVVEVSGEDFKPSAIVPLLDTNMKIIFSVHGDAPAAALSRVISPGVFVQQLTGDESLESFTAFKGIAVAARKSTGTSTISPAAPVFGLRKF
ncbi:MAG: hypothetical protein ACE5EK_02155, partial [Nitrospinales bacterium]